MDKLLRRSEAAQALGLSERKVDKLRADGTLPEVRIGAAVRIPASAVAAIIDSAAQRAATSEPQ